MHWYVRKQFRFEYFNLLSQVFLVVTVIKKKAESVFGSVIIFYKDTGM